MFAGLMAVLFAGEPDREDEFDCEGAGEHPHAAAISITAVPIQNGRIARSYHGNWFVR
jgi:DNA polymerase III epsilon subunit-like protein